MTAKSELRKALTSTGDGAALNPYDLDPVLNEELLKLQPLAVLIDTIQAEGRTHEFTVRSRHPFAWFEGETTPANPKNSAYIRKNVQLKIQRIWGSVTGFAQAVDERFVNALAAELEGSLEGASNLMEYGLIWGTAGDLGFTGDGFQYSGIMPHIFKYAPKNVINAGGSKVSLDMLDQAFAKSASFRGVRTDPRVWVMGTRMKQVVDGLQTRVQIPLTSVELADGQIRMAAYANAGILESDFVVPEEAGSSMVENLSATAAASGALESNTTYKYQIASVTMFGEQVACEAKSVSLGASDKSVELEWDADPNAVLYYIFRATGSGEAGLIDIIPALTYDSDGKVNGFVETYIDNGSRPQIAEVQPLQSGEQNILLANLNPRRGVAFLGKIDSMGRPVENLWSYVDLARTKDSYDYMLKAYLALRIVHPNLFSVVRRVALK